MRMAEVEDVAIVIPDQCGDMLSGVESRDCECHQPPQQVETIIGVTPYRSDGCGQPSDVIRKEARNNLYNSRCNRRISVNTKPRGTQAFKTKFEIDCIKWHHREQVDATRLLEVVIELDEIRHRDPVEFLKQGHCLFHNPLHRQALMLRAHIRPTVQGLPMEVGDVPVAQQDVVGVDSRIATIFNDSNC